MTKRKSTRFIWDESDITITDSVPEYIKRIVKKSPVSSMEKGKYYLELLDKGEITQNELNFILDRGL